MKKLNELTTLNKHPFIKNMRDAAKAGSNSITNAISLAATDTYGDKAVAKSKPAWGSFGGVFSGKDTVLKVYHDPAYADFVNHAKANQHDPHMPRIYSHTRTSDGIGLVRMEKLHPYEHSGEGYHDLGPDNSTLWDARTGAGLHTLLNDVPGRAMMTHNPTLHKSLNHLAKSFPNHAMDIHPANVMKRGDGTTVITDPFWDEKHFIDRKNASNLLKEMMTLNKLPLVHNIKSMKTPEWHDQGDALSDKLGVKNRLGTGFRGVAYQHKDHVIKVYRHDKAYHDFVNYALKNQDDPHMPKIYAHKVIDSDKHMGVVKMEKLLPAHNEYNANGGLFHTLKYAERVYHEDYIPPFMSKDHEQFKQDFPTLHSSLQRMGSHPGLKLPRPDGFLPKFDIHANNIMKRPGTRHLVFSDPLI